MADSQVVLASNRGPVSFEETPTGELVSRPGAGGLSSALSGLPAQDAALWVCAALSPADRAAARAGLDGFDVGSVPIRMVDIDPATLQRAYNGIANSTLWFLHHLLFDPATTPVFDAHFRSEWQAYIAYNAEFAAVIAAEATDRARVVVQDYHLTLLPAMLRSLRPDLRIAHFSHTPWAPPEYFRILPDDLATSLLEGLLASDHIGFHCARWADAFVRCCRAYGYDDPAPRVGVHPLGVDAAGLRARLAAPDVRERLAGLEDLADLRTIVRVDRSELSKNIVRGLEAYRTLLRTRPEWHGRVTHLVFAYPSRHELAEYRRYASEVRRVAAEIRAEFGTPAWDPLELAVDDDLPRSLAAYTMADVAVVNPIRDGMNLVAKEVCIASERSCALVLSREAGAADELGADALLVNPYDVEETAEALHRALSMPDTERRERADRLAASSAAHPPALWLAEQLTALARV